MPSREVLSSSGAPATSGASVSIRIAPRPREHLAPFRAVVAADRAGGLRGRGAGGEPGPSRWIPIVRRQQAPALTCSARLPTFASSSSAAHATVVARNAVVPCRASSADDEPGARSRRVMKDQRAVVVGDRKSPGPARGLRDDGARGLGRALARGEPRLDPIAPHKQAPRRRPARLGIQQHGLAQAARSHGSADSIRGSARPGIVMRGDLAAAHGSLRSASDGALPA